MRNTCKFCGESIEWLLVRFGHLRERRYQRLAPVSAEPDAEGRVVLWNGEWIKLRNCAPLKVDVEFRRKLHGRRQCITDDKGDN